LNQHIQKKRPSHEDDSSTSSSESMLQKLEKLKAALKKERKMKEQCVEVVEDTSKDEEEDESMGSTNEEDSKDRMESPPLKKSKHTEEPRGTQSERSTADLLQRYTQLAATKNPFGRKASSYVLKFNVLKDSPTARFYFVQMELSNNEEGEQLNIWLKATSINDVLKCLATDDEDSIPMFNGFQDVVNNSSYGTLRMKPFGDDIPRSNTKNGYTFKDNVNYFLIPREMGKYNSTVEKFKETMTTVLKSDQFFAMMTVYQNEKYDQGGKIGKVLRDPKSDVWTQIRTENNVRLNYIDSLNAKFIDDDINDILHKLFGENSIEARHQKFGWKDRDSNPWQKSKKN